MAVFHCPKCGRVLGETDYDIDGLRINCPGCRTRDVEIRFKIADFGADYLEKGEENDKSE